MTMVDYVCHRFVVSSSCEVTCVHKKALSYTLEVKNFKDKTFCSREWNIPGEIGKWHCCWCPDDMASAAMVLTSWILSLFCPAKHGYCDVNILTSGHPCQYHFLSFVDCVFIHVIIIFYFPELYYMHWIGCLGTLSYEICNYLFVLWTNVHNAFFIIFPECLVGYLYWYVVNF